MRTSNKDKKGKTSKRIPGHIGFILDGNGRWAKKRGLARKFGHREGYSRMVSIVKHCADLGIKAVSYFAFSTENWKRPQEEIDEIFRIIRENMRSDSEEFIRHGIRIVTMGDITMFPKDLQEALQDLADKTKGNTRCTMNLCVNYGGRADIVRATNNIIASRQEAASTAPVTEEEFATYLYNPELPPLDFVVRTSGEMRISNFMLYQMAYAELYFIKLFWPDINNKWVDKCIAEYGKRKRRFGRVAPAGS